jgi:hypothetical protein
VKRWCGKTARHGSPTGGGGQAQVREDGRAWESGMGRDSDDPEPVAASASRQAVLEG